jgi:hypothetical protein
VLCFDAPKDHIILPCFHVCVCEACAHRYPADQQGVPLVDRPSE